MPRARKNFGIITIAGIKRSGSTAVYNMVRIICEHMDLDNLNLVGEPYTLKKGMNIVKIHPFDELLCKKSDLVILTDREDAEILESLAKFGYEHKPIDEMRFDFNRWKKERFENDDYNFIRTIEFNHIVNAPKVVFGYLLDEISHVFGVHFEFCEIQQMFEEWKEVKPKEEYDPITFLFPNHISK